MAKVSSWQARELQNNESLRLQTYDDATGLPVPVGGAWTGVLTIGYGHTGPDVTPGRVITTVTADELFRADLARFEVGVESTLARPATQEQFDAMVSLAYNIGLGRYSIPGVQDGRGFKGSTVLKMFNSGFTEESAVAFMLWIKQGPIVKAGLIKRRAREMVRFLGGWKP